MKAHFCYALPGPGETNDTNSILPSGEMAEAIELLESARGVLECVAVLGGPDVDPSKIDLKEHVCKMSAAAAGAARLVRDAQAFLIEAKVVESEAGHG